jgi:hypothetical protein
MENQSKKFMCFWDEKFFEKGKTELKNLEFFSEEKGYFQENIKEIKKLEVGTSFTPEKGHIVTRVQ